MVFLTVTCTIARRTTDTGEPKGARMWWVYIGPSANQKVQPYASCSFLIAAAQGHWSVTGTVQLHFFLSLVWVEGGPQHGVNSMWVAYWGLQKETIAVGWRRMMVTRF